MSGTSLNHRRQRTPRVRSVCILRRWRGAAAIAHFSRWAMKPVALSFSVLLSGCRLLATPQSADTTIVDILTDRTVEGFAIGEPGFSSISLSGGVSLTRESLLRYSGSQATRGLARPAGG